VAHGRRVAVLLVLFGVFLGLLIVEHPPRGTHPPAGQFPQGGGPRAGVDPVDGELTAPDRAARRSIAVIVDNFPAARPQWGLRAASRVYEALTEGGITRYMAVFTAHDADRVGPVRSARTQFLDYALELHSALAHVGGNADALALIRETGLVSLDQLRYGAAYRRIPARGVAYEHTVFTSTRILRELLADRGWADPSPLPSPPRWEDGASEGPRPAVSRIAIDFSGPAYRVEWVYRPQSHDYLRVLAGKPDTDAATGQPLTARSIAIIVVPRVHGRTVINEDTWTYADLGSGRAWVVQDGTVLPAQWRKPTRESPLRFADGSGQDIAFERGPQWVEIIPPEVSPAFGSGSP
jgi:hypothetical protein